MPDTLHLDYESLSEPDLRKVGLDVYSRHPSTCVSMASYRINDGSLRQWQAHEARFPRELREALLDPHVLKWGFNAQYERVMTRNVLRIDTPIRGWRCAMVLAYMQSFTGGLKNVAEQIGLPLDKQKMTDGGRLIRKFCLPQKITKNQPHLWRNHITDPEDWEVFTEYNRQDVVTEEAIVQRLSPFPILEEEWGYYELDQLINDRGIPVDFDFIDNLIWMSGKRKRELLARIEKITRLDNPNSVSQLLPWLRSEGYPYTDLRKESVAKTLKRVKAGDVEVTKDCRLVLRLRQWAARTSVSKAIKAKLVVTDDGRARYLYQFCGASRTNRASGREIQPQNMVKTPKTLDAEEDDTRLSYVTDVIRDGDYDGLGLLFIEPMLALTGCMRGMFRAPDGRVFMVCDYSSVESAGLAWVTRCPKLLDVFATGRDPYKSFGVVFYDKLYEEITREERNICKPPMLGCGYRLGPGIEKEGVKTGLLAYAENMGIDMTSDEAQRGVRIFREEYPEVPQFWYDCEKAIRHVIITHHPYTVGYIRFEWLKPYLLIRLPSGRYIYYYKPRLEKRVVDTGRMRRRRERDSRGEWYTVEEPETYIRNVFTYMGRHQKTGQWTRLEGHGGVVTENIVQALTRDILYVGLDRLHKADFEVIGHSHDEGLVEVDIGENYHTLDLMREEMTAPIEWAPGFPLKAAGWVGPFYRK